MRAVWSIGVAMVVGVILVTSVAVHRASADSLRCPDYVITEGQVLEIGDTTITIHEWAGDYTYRLPATERWNLESSQIRPGDNVQFLGCRAGEFAKDFKKVQPK